MSAAKDLNTAYANLRKAQNELEQTLQDLGIDPWHFECRMDEVQEVVECWVSELDEGTEPQDLTQEFVFERQ
jgi:hypothetical protein